MRKSIVFLSLSLCLGGNTFLKAQTDVESGRAWIVGTGFSFNSTSGPWSDRFDNNYSVGLSLGRKTAENWIFQVEGNFLFGGEVPNREAALGNVFTENSQVLNLNGSYAQVNINQRGTYFGVGVEKILPFLDLNQNSGFSVSAQGGLIWHWLNIDNVGADVPQINQEWEKGYDRMQRGTYLSESIGWRYHSTNRRINFKLSLVATQLYTRDLRTYHYPTGLLNQEPEWNQLYSLKLQWFLPIYLGGRKEQYYYN